jgi:hypothetical protein
MDPVQNIQTKRIFRDKDKQRDKMNTDRGEDGNRQKDR